MSNIQHSSRSDEWYTPAYLVELAREVLGEIELDPASSEAANKTVRAKRYLTEQDDALSCCWTKTPVSIYINPPGGKLGNKSMTALFWQRLLDVRCAGLLDHAVFMGFSLEHLAVTQGCTQSMVEFPFCIPAKRIRFVSPDGCFNSPTHSNVIVYVPGLTNVTSRFKEIFSQLGAVK